MYGFIHRALADLIEQKFGADKWNDILLSSGIDLHGGTFLLHRVYSDRDTLKLISASSRILGLPEEDVLEAFGDHFVKYCKASGYDRLLRVLGRNLFEFLSNLDALHDHLATSYPGMRSPSFRCTMGDNSDILLHYHSQRKGLYPIVVGIVKYVAIEFFQTGVVLNVLKNYDNDHVIFSIRPLSTKGSLTNFTSSTNRMKEISTNPFDLKMDIQTFCDTFPFHIVFDKKLEIVHLGNTLRRMTIQGRQERSSTRLNVRDVFTIVRPVVKFTFDSLVSCTNSVFVLSLIKRNPVRLKGQMIHLRKQQMILFMGSPRAASMQDLQKSGIYPSDFKLHDTSREIVELYQTRPIVTRLMEQLEESSNNLRLLQHNLRKEQEKNADLLNSIFPPSIVVKLCSNVPVEATAYDPATILFCDIVGFTSLCGDDKIDPMDIVQFLNELYSKLDVLCDANNLFKVETIGDAYMVAGGIPDYVLEHADHVVDMATGISEITNFVNLPIYGKHVRMRIGVHSGPCIAGMVGKTMLRYCLFGNSVNVANDLEKFCEPGRVNISSSTRRYLTDVSKYQFVENLDGPQYLETCYYVELLPKFRRRLLNQLDSLGLMEDALSGTMLLTSLPYSSASQLSEIITSQLSLCAQACTASESAPLSPTRTTQQTVARKVSEEKGVKEVSAMERRRKVSYRMPPKPRILYREKTGECRAAQALEERVCSRERKVGLQLKSGDLMNTLTSTKFDEVSHVEVEASYEEAARQSLSPESEKEEDDCSSNAFHPETQVSSDCVIPIFSWNFKTG